MSDPAAAASPDDVPELDEQSKNLSKEQAAESNQLDKVTDFAEEVEMDTSKAEQALSNLTNSAETAEETRQAQELAAVKVKQEDIDLLSTELEIGQEEAEKRIRIAKGDLAVAIANALL